MLFKPNCRVSQANVSPLHCAQSGSELPAQIKAGLVELRASQEALVMHAFKLPGLLKAQQDAQLQDWLGQLSRGVLDARVDAASEAIKAIAAKNSRLIQALKDAKAGAKDAALALQKASEASDAIMRKYDSNPALLVTFGELATKEHLKTPDDVRATIVTLQAKFSRLAVDNEAVKRYKTLSDDLALLESHQANAQGETVRARASFNENLARFEDDLMGEVAKINTHFVEVSKRESIIGMR